MKAKHFLLVCNIFTSVFLFLCALANAENEKGSEINSEKETKAYYSYLITSYKKEADEINKKWTEKYKKMIMHRKFSEIPIKIVFAQGHRPDCMPTCIAIICDYYNIKHEPQWMIGRRIRTRRGGKQSGTSAYNAVKELKSVGLNACMYESSISDLKDKIEAGTPVIVSQKYKKDVEDGHARIVIGYNDLNAEFTVIDPNFGNKKLYVKYKDFMELWDSRANCAILAFKD